MYKLLPPARATSSDESWITVAGCCGIHGPCMPSQMALLSFAYLTWSSHSSWHICNPPLIPLPAVPHRGIVCCVCTLSCPLPSSFPTEFHVEAPCRLFGYGCRWTHNYSHWQLGCRPTCWHYEQTAQIDYPLKHEHLIVDVTAHIQNQSHTSELDIHMYWRDSSTCLANLPIAIIFVVVWVGNIAFNCHLLYIRRAGNGYRSTSLKTHQSNVHTCKFTTILNDIVTLWFAFRANA